VEATDFDSLAPDFQYWVEHQSHARLLAAIKKIIPHRGMVLDAGCGSGSLSIALAPHVDGVVGIDLSPRMISIAAQQSLDAGVRNVSFVIGDLQRPGLRDCCFDAVVSSFVLHHTSIQTTIPGLIKLMKPGGWFVMLEPVCPVSGVLRPLWYRWQGVRTSAAAFRQHGPAVSWKIGRFYQGRAWMKHQLEDRHWNTAKWRAEIKHLLPDALIRPTPDHTSVMVLWQKAQMHDKPGKNRPPAASGKRIPVPDSSVQVKRAYPLRPPDDYTPFPHSALEDSVVSRFESQAALHRERMALRSAAFNMTYGELNAAANRLAWRLLSESRDAGARTAILMDQDDPVVPAIIGVLKSGNAYVVVDPKDAPERNDRVLSFAGADTLITSKSRTRLLKSLNSSVNIIVWEDLDDSPETNPEVPLGPDTLAAIFFTSGSTGEPKGVVRDHRQFLHSTWLNTNTYYLSPSDRQSLLYFPGFTASVPNIYDSLLNGAELNPLNLHNVSPSSLQAWLRENRITHFNPPVGLWRELVRAAPALKEWPDLRLVTLVGQPIYSSDIRDFQALLGPGTALLHLLAMTEAGAVTQGYVDHSSVAGDGQVPVGYPLPDKEISIIDTDGSIITDGSIGRVTITSRYLSLGYWQDQARTETAFVETADDSGNRTFITSDRGRLRADGCLEYFGREDSVVKIRGYRVDTASIERMLHCHPQVEQAVVVPQKRLYGDIILVAYLTGERDNRPSSDSLRSHLARSLPRYMTPEIFTWIDEFPLTASGKIDRQTMLLRRTPRPAMSEPFVKPHTELERQVAAIWAELLELEKVGVNDDFVDLGGDSLLAMRMLQQLEQHLGIVASENLTRASTIRQLVSAISSETVYEPVDAGSSAAAAAQSWADRIAHQVRYRLSQAGKFTPKRWLRRKMSSGPIWHGHVLPYGLGVRLHRAAAMPLRIQQALFPEELTITRQWQKELSVVPNDEDIKASLLSNTWIRWRHLALSKPGVFEKWVDIIGEGKTLMEVPDISRGIVFLLPHTGRMMATIQHQLEAQGRETVSVAIDLSIRNMGDAEGWYKQQTKSRTSMLWKAKEVLQNRGAVLIAGDGRQGHHSIDIPFHGRRRPFQTGAAWLAVMSDALFVPVFVIIDVSGRIVMDVSAPLQLPDSSKEEQIIGLTKQYGELFARRWHQYYTSVHWFHQGYNFNLPRV